MKPANQKVTKRKKCTPISRAPMYFSSKPPIHIPYPQEKDGSSQVRAAKVTLTPLLSFFPKKKTPEISINT